MRRIDVPGTSVTVSRFGFGTARLHHIYAQRSQVALLEAAIDQGFSHFDTSPYYGFGLAESAIGVVARRHASITIATKVGLYPRGGRQHSRYGVLLRKAAGKLVPSLSKPLADWTVARARKSLDDSLSALGRDHIDFLFLHEPEYSLVQSDEWLCWLEDERRVRHFGIAGASANIKPFILNRSKLAQIVQIGDSLGKKEADIVLDAGRPLQFTYGYMSAATTPAAPQDVLAGMLQRNTTGTILVSTRSVERLAQYSIASERQAATLSS